MNYPKCSSLPLSALLFSLAIGCGSAETETSNTDDDTPAAASEVSFELEGSATHSWAVFFEVHRGLRCPHCCI